MGNGKKIHQACEIIRKTYKEINRLKDDLSDLLSEYDQELAFTEEYSYSPNSLYLKPRHTFLYKRKKGEQESMDGVERILGAVCMFFDEGSSSRISLKDEPELWVGLLDIQNRGVSCRPWNFYSVLEITGREGFKEEIRVGGEVFEYYWENKEPVGKGREWRGKFVGYPLVEISDREAISTLILDKLFYKN
jgi:hypothetical protein